jgi:phosphopentomutase
MAKVRAKKVILLVLDSVGVGGLPDAADFGDEGANTLANTARAVGGLSLPNLQKLGLGNITNVLGVPPADNPSGAFGKMAEASPAKDTVIGHWELSGLISTKPFATFPDGFPPDLMARFEKAADVQWLFNGAASGTEILERLGAQQMETGKVIVYTSADSVFQIAAHEEVVPIQRQYEICQAARKVIDDYHMARVICRPFVGQPGDFSRTFNRKDFCMAPHGPTLLDAVAAAGMPVVGVGKIEDIFSGRGVTRSIHTEGNDHGCEVMLELAAELAEGLIFVNLVEFDSHFGHRRNPEGYAEALERADRYIGKLAAQMDDETVVLITADHGCDPTHSSHTDHTREYVPMLYFGRAIPQGLDLGSAPTFAAAGATIASLLGLQANLAGQSAF